MTHDQWDLLADAVNPILLVVFLSFTFFKFLHLWQHGSFLTPFGLALLITWTLAHLDHWIPALRDLTGFPSGHMAFYCTVATSFALLIPHSLGATLPVALLYGSLIVSLDYHSWWDLLTAVMLAVPVTLLCHWASKPKPVR